MIFFIRKIRISQKFQTQFYNLQYLTRNIKLYLKFIFNTKIKNNKIELKLKIDNEILNIKF